MDDFKITGSDETLKAFKKMLIEEFGEDSKFEEDNFEHTGIHHHKTWNTTVSCLTSSSTPRV